MYGKGILKGLSVTWKRFWDTYTEDISWMMRGKKRYNTDEGIRHRSSKDTKGIFTVQYPEEQLIVPEEFRYVPFLVYDEGADSADKSKAIWCAKDQAKAWQDFMVRDLPVPAPAANCDTSALTRNVDLGRNHKITGTPTLIFIDGARVPGAIDATQVEKMLTDAKG